MTPPAGAGFRWSAAIPLACAVAAVFLCAVAGLSQRSVAGTVLEDRFYGYFLRSYPLFLFAVIYGLAGILVAAAADAGPRKAWRLVTTPLALGLFLAGCFYPTFGGIVLRSGFGTGSMSVVYGQTATAALLFGTFAAALAFGAVLGTATVLARARIRLTRKAVAWALGSLFALWAGALVLEAPRRLGIDLLDGFPLRPLSLRQAPALAVLVALALLPHTAVAARRSRFLDPG